ncbi:MAG TPA: SDR family NAD(P)-dependent oxidoreductase, partial [Aestuariivirga sp.]
MKVSLHNKNVVITGSSRGIGLGIAKCFANANARLTLIADDPAVIAIAKEIGATGTLADITDGTTISQALSALSHIDVLINNAGLELLTPIADGGDEVEETFRRII